MEAQKVGVEAVFRKYTRLPGDKQCFLLDVRDHKSFKRHHLLLSYCVRLSSDGRALLDYSKSSYDVRWSQHVWWGADIIVIGGAGLKKDHEVITFLVNEGRVPSVSYLKDGIEAFEKEYPFLVGQSLKAHRGLVYPSPVVPKQLYLGSWDNAADTEKLAHLRISRVVTLHNEPKNLRLPNTCKQMAITAADLATTDLTPYFDPTFVFIEESIAAKRAVLVHCGAGSSRSATICAAYLMRKQRMSAHTALMQLHQLRSTVCPNEGFWRQLCAFEKELGLPPGQQSIVDKPPLVNASYGQTFKDTKTEGTAGSKVEVKVSAAQRDAGEQRADKRSRDDGNDAGSSAADADKRVRPASGAFAGSSKVTASLQVDISKDDKAVGSLELPTLRPHQRCVFGRGDNVDVKLDHASLSRHHAELAVTLDGAVSLTDLGSSHGTNVDGAWVKPQEAKLLRVGTRFRFAASSRTNPHASMGFYDAFKVGEPDDQIELDLTNAHLKSLESQDFKSSLEYVDLTANRLRDIDERILQLPGLRFICFRQNLLADASALSDAACQKTLEKLNLADNKLTEIPDLSTYEQLQTLEFSYNHEIRSLSPLSQLQGLHLTDLYCAENKIGAIEAIAHLTKLSVLELGSNRIKAIEQLDTLTGLQQLWLGRNRITEVVNLAALTNLRQLSLQANRLESMAGVGACIGLEELYLSQNGITAMEDLAPLVKLTVLDLAMNRLEQVQGLQHQTRLTDLWLNDNPVKDLDHLEEALAACKDTLQVVYLENSPAAKSTTAYLHIMKQLLPKLEQLDSTPVQRS